MAVVRPVAISEFGRTPETFPVVFAFMWLTSFGLMNIVVGVIVENTLNAAKQNDEVIRQRLEAKTARHLEVMKDIFEAADEDESGTMDRDEFKNLMEKDETKTQFQLLDLPWGDAEILFDLLDEARTGEIGIATFIEGVMKLKGAANAKDLMGLVMSTKSITNRVNRIEDNRAFLFDPTGRGIGGRKATQVRHECTLNQSLILTRLGCED